MTEDGEPISPYLDRKTNFRETIHGAIDYHRGIAQHKKDIEPLKDTRVLPPPIHTGFTVSHDIPVAIMLYNIDDPLGKAMAAKSVNPTERTYYSSESNDASTIAKKIRTHRSQSAIPVGVRYAIPLNGEPELESRKFQEIVEALQKQGYSGAQIGIIPMRTIMAEAARDKAIQAAYGKDIGDLLWQTQDRIKKDPDNKSDYMENFLGIIRAQFKDLYDTLHPELSDDKDLAQRKDAQGVIAFSFANDFANWFLSQQNNILFDPRRPRSPLQIPNIEIRMGEGKATVYFDERAENSYGHRGPSISMTRSAPIPLSGFPEKERIVLAGYRDSVGRMIGRTIYERSVQTQRGEDLVIEREIDTNRSKAIVERELPKILDGEIIRSSEDDA